MKRIARTMRMLLPLEASTGAEFSRGAGVPDPDDDTWENAENVTWGAQDAIKQYQENKKRYTNVRIHYKNPHGW